MGNGDLRLSGELIEGIDKENPARLRASLAFLPGQWKSLLLLLSAISLLPILIDNDYLLLLFNIMALNAMVVLGLNLLVGSTGQISLGHAAFYGLGAYLSAFASTTWQWPLPAALLFCIVCVAVVGSLLALPTLRLEGHYLVMATLGFNIIINIIFNQFESFSGGPSGFPGIPRLHLGSVKIDTDLAFYHFIWPLVILMLACTLNLGDSRMGRAMKAIHDKELTAQSLGIPVEWCKTSVFVLSCLYAAFAGFCYAHYITFISPKTFDIFYSVQVVTMVAVGGMGNLWGGLAGAALLTAMPELLHRFEDVHTVLYGLVLMAVLVFCPDGLLGRARMFRIRGIFRGDKTRSTRKKPGVGSYRGAAGSRGGLLEEHLKPKPRVAGSPAVILAGNGIHVNFGGISALDEVSMQVHTGEVLAVIGPNGAGKTTLFNALTGLVLPSAGTIRVGDTQVVGMPPHRIAALGVGRTFQSVQVFKGLTVLDNLLIGFHLAGKAGFFRGYLHTPGERREEAGLRSRAMGLLQAFGLEDWCDSPAVELTLIQQKTLELARAVAASPSILLLDEPAGGLNPRESEIFSDYILQIRELGPGIILIEHDMNMVAKLADRILVLNYGRVIAEGSPGEIRRNPEVIAAYLGSKRMGRQKPLA